MFKLTTTLIALSLASVTHAADFNVKLTGGWNGSKVPAGQHCKLHGGKGRDCGHHAQAHRNGKRAGESEPEPG